MKELVQRELAFVRGQPDKIPQNGLAVAQLIWPEDHLVEHQIGPFVHVGSRENPDGEKVVITGKVRGRKSGRAAVSQEDSNLFSGTKRSIKKVTSVSRQIR